MSFVFTKENHDPTFIVTQCALLHSSDCNCELMNLDVLSILLVLCFTCKRIFTAFNQNNLGLYLTVSRLSLYYLQRSVRLRYPGAVRSRIIAFGKSKHGCF